MLNKLGMTIGTEALFMTSITVLAVLLGFPAMDIRPVQGVLSPYLVAICAISLFMAGSTLL
jgi:hypothetical protein